MIPKKFYKKTQDDNTESDNAFVDGSSTTKALAQLKNTKKSIPCTANKNGMAASNDLSLLKKRGNAISREEVDELFSAVIFSPYKQACELIHKRKNLAVKDTDGSTLLHHLYRFPPQNQLEMARYFLEHQVPVNEQTMEGNTPLHHVAFSNSDVDLLNYLVSQGADVKQVNNEGKTVLHFAAYLNKLNLVKELIQHHQLCIYDTDYKGNTLLHQAMIGDAPDVVEYLVKQGLSLQAINHKRQTPLIYVISEGNSSAYIKYQALYYKNSLPGSSIKKTLTTSLDTPSPNDCLGEQIQDNSEEASLSTIPQFR